MLAKESGSSKGPRRSETAQAVVSVVQFMPARELGSSKGPRRSETTRAASSVVRVVRARNTRVD